MDCGPLEKSRDGEEATLQPGSGPVSWLARKYLHVQGVYSKAVLSHLEAITYGESALRTLLFFTPGRLGDTEIASELAYGGVGLIALFHDTIILQHLRRLRRRDITPVAYQQLAHIPPAKDMLFHVALSVTNSVELLAELVAEHKYGQRNRWHWVMAIEAWKACLKIMLLIRNGGHMLVHQYVPDRNSFANAKINPESVNREYEQWQEVYRPVQEGHGVRRTPLTTWQLVGEYLHILRPILYLLAVFRYSRRSWRSLGVGLGVDVISHWMGPPAHVATPLERSELSRRRGLWAFYMLRSPIFEALLRWNPFVIFKRLPGGTTLANLIYNYLALYRRYYFYTAGS